jgi:Tfp pilus assembly protein PilV
MTLRRRPERAHAPHAESGFMLIEVMVAALVLGIGIVGIVASFDSGRRLTSLSERRTVMAHRAQLEIERLQSYPYSELAMVSAPVHSSEKTNPDYYVNSSPSKCTSLGDGCYAYNGESTAEEETLVPAGKNGECTAGVSTECGVLSSSPTGRKCSETTGACEWSDGTVEGKVYDFVTWHSDGHCGSACPTKADYKRLTVVVTAKVPAGNHEPAAVRVSTFVVEAG